MQGKNENLDTAKNTKLDLKVIYDICEKHGISKEIISILDKEISMYNNLSYDIVSAKNNSRKLSFS